MAGILNNLFKKEAAGKGDQISEEALQFNEKGVALYLDGNFAQAIQEFDRALRKEPNYVEVLVQKGDCLMNLDRPKEAIPWLLKALNLDPYNSDGWLNLGLSEDKLGNLANAIHDYEVYLLFAPDIAIKVIFFTEQRLHALGIADIAGEITRLKINTKNLPRVQKQLDSNNPTILAGKGRCLLLLGKYEQSIALYDQGIQIDPNFSLLYVGKSIPLQLMGKFEVAIQVLDQALRVDPQNSNAWYQKGKCLRSLGRLSDALQCFDQTLIYNQEDSYGALFEKAEMEEALGLITEAIQTYQRCLEIPVLDPQILEQPRKRLQELLKTRINQ